MIMYKGGDASSNPDVHVNITKLYKKQQQTKGQQNDISH